MDDIKRNLVKLGKSFTKASGKLIKNTKLNLELNTEEEKIRKIYIEIGQKVHEIYSYGGSIGKFFDEKYIQIVQAEEKIAEIKNIINIQNEKLYSSHKSDKINISLDESNINNKPILQDNSDIKEEYKTCNSCGELNIKNEKFCLKCGRGLL